VKGKVVAIAETPVTVVGNVVSELPQRTTNGHEVVTFWMRSNERLRPKLVGQGDLLAQARRVVGVSLGKGDPGDRHRQDVQQRLRRRWSTSLCT
jgi:hypothetical protein